MTPAPSVRPPLSILDLALVNQGSTSGRALADATEVAQVADRLGYRRFWVAEHHNMASVASTTPPVLMAHLAARTERIKVGSGGIMLPNHAPLVVAEHIAALEALHPGRIDVGIGRAPGSDPATAAALRRVDRLDVDDFPRDLLDLMGLLGDERGEGGLWQRFRATPVATSTPEVVLLGSSGYSAQLAGILGLPFSFAHHFGMGAGLGAAELYRSAFRPSPVLDEPHLIITANVLVAKTVEEAAFQAGPGRLMTRLIRSGRFEPLRTPEEAARLLGEAESAPADPLRVAAARRHGPGPSDGNRSVVTTGRVASTAEVAVAQLDELVAAAGAQELMVSTVAHDLDVRVESFELLAEAWSL